MDKKTEIAAPRAVHFGRDPKQGAGNYYEACMDTGSGRRVHAAANREGMK